MRLLLTALIIVGCNAAIRGGGRASGNGDVGGIPGYRSGRSSANGNSGRPTWRSLGPVANDEPFGPLRTVKNPPHRIDDLSKGQDPPLPPPKSKDPPMETDKDPLPKSKDPPPKGKDPLPKSKDHAPPLPKSKDPPPKSKDSPPKSKDPPPKSKDPLPKGEDPPAHVGPLPKSADELPPPPPPAEQGSDGPPPEHAVERTAAHQISDGEHRGSGQPLLVSFIVLLIGLCCFCLKPLNLLNKTSSTASSKTTSEHEALMADSEETIATPVQSSYGTSATPATVVGVSN